MVKAERREVRLAADRREQRRDEGGHERGHERAERGADHDGDRELDDVPAHDEVPKLFEHPHNARSAHGRRHEPPLPDRDPAGLAQQVRVGPGAAGDQAQPLPVLLGPLSDRLRLHHRHDRPARRRARHARVRGGRDLPRLPDRGAPRRRAADDRRGGAERQARLRPRRRSRLGGGRGARRHADASCAPRSSTSTRCTSSPRARTSTSRAGTTRAAATKAIEKGRKRYQEENP